jgi:hypothetical protein
LALGGLAVPVELPRRPWTLDPREARNSRRINLPPGAYRAEIRVRALVGPAVVRMEVFAGDLVLATADAEDGATIVPLLLPAGGRGLAVSATGVSGRAEVEQIAIVPEALVPSDRRASFPWPEAPLADRYRVESNGIRVTVLDRTAPEAGGYRVRGEGQFLVEGPVGATARATVRTDSGSGEILWGARSIPFRGSGVVELAMAEGAQLGRTAVVPVRVRASDAWVSFALQGR